VSTDDAKALVRRTIQAQNNQDRNDLLETIDAELRCRAVFADP
jgi:hypothetical protein